MRPNVVDSQGIAQRMQDLPAEAAPPLSWAEFQPRMVARRVKPALAWRYAALAAGIAALVAGLALWSRVPPPGRPLIFAGTPPELPMLTLPDSRSLVQAAASERWLARLPAEPAVVRVSAHMAVADLEDRIAWVDDTLSDEGLDAVNPTHVAALQHERARLVNSLAQVRYAETLVAAVP
jgi:hypothetical protein